jgi:hypothetical protein
MHSSAGFSRNNKNIIENKISNKYWRTNGFYVLKSENVLISF